MIWDQKAAKKDYMKHLSQVWIVLEDNRHRFAKENAILPKELGFAHSQYLQKFFQKLLTLLYNAI